MNLDAARDAVRLGEFDSTDTGLAEITQRRTYLRPIPPPRAISNIHKAKGSSAIPSF